MPLFNEIPCIWVREAQMAYLFFRTLAMRQQRQHGKEDARTVIILAHGILVEGQIASTNCGENKFYLEL